MNVPYREAKAKCISRLIVLKNKILELPSRYFVLQLGFAVTIADEQKCNSSTTQHFRCSQDRVEFMNATQVTGVHYDEPI